MKTVTEIQVSLTFEEKEILKNATDIIGSLRRIAGLTFDKVSFRCWDIDHDYVAFDFDKLRELENMMHDIYIAHEVGFTHIQEGEENDKR